MGKTIEIKVGTIFSVVGCPGRTDLAIETPKRGNYFFASQCEITNESINMIGYPGTAGPEYIQEIIKTINPDEVERLLVLFWETLSKRKLDKEFLEMIHQSTANSRPRRFRLG